jgi:hypothetical protein
MADVMETAFEQHFDCTPEDPSGYESAMMEEYGWYREGEPTTDVIAMSAEIEEEPAKDIQSVLSERHFDEELARMSVESPFDEDAHYAEKPVDDAESKAGWRHFEESIKTQARYFNRTAEDSLRLIFADLSDHKTSDGRSVIIEAGPGTELTEVYRARVFQSYEKLEEALKRPDEEIGAPPARVAASGRMNAHGIAVFYGATNPMIALAEVRPPVGSKVVVGRFELLRPLRLLDIKGLQSVSEEGSLFDPDYMRRLERAKFLRWLGREITQPVMPDDEPFGYLATQAIADFLATEADPPLDGILYPSVQGSEEKLNLVLFHKTSRIAPVEIPKGAQLSLMVHGEAEEGEESDYVVWEEVPKETSSETPPALLENFASPILPASTDPYVPEVYDGREVTLRLDLSTLQVHHVRSVVFNTIAGSVRRHRSEIEVTSPAAVGEIQEDFDF